MAFIEIVGDDGASAEAAELLEGDRVRVGYVPTTRDYSRTALRSTQAGRR